MGVPTARGRKITGIEGTDLRERETARGVTLTMATDRRARPIRGRKERPAPGRRAALRMAASPKRGTAADPREDPIVDPKGLRTAATGRLATVTRAGITETATARTRNLRAKEAGRVRLSPS